MKKLPEILENNRKWAEAILKENPDFFKRLENQQAPKYLWIGCSDSRVPANQICGLGPGEVFVHRNVANIVDHADFNCLSVIQFAVEVLKVEHIIVCGHYDCGGVNAALSRNSFGLIDNWLMNIKDIIFQYKEEIENIHDLRAQQNRLSELNVKSQVLNLCHTTVVQNAWKEKRPLTVHGWIYSISDGRLKDLDVCFNSYDEVENIYKVRTKL